MPATAPEGLSQGAGPVKTRSSLDPYPIPDDPVVILQNPVGGAALNRGPAEIVFAPETAGKVPRVRLRRDTYR